ncbi:MAG: cupin domain-containing protein [Candidatus Thermoplasmatota archaeon]|nr:cupin domain-containing protein [Candidatus Thermoplasmatota archaeon]
MEPIFEHLQVIDVPDEVEKCTEKWFNETLCRVNGSLLRLGIFEGEYHWHRHEKEDELFFVLSGDLIIETERGPFHLKKDQGICVPKGVLHRPVSKERSVVLMVEEDTVNPRGD